VVSFTPRPLYPEGKIPWYPLDGRLGGSQSRSGRGGEEKNSHSLPGFEPPIIQPVDQHYTNELFRLPQNSVTCTFEIHRIVKVLQTLFPNRVAVSFLWTLLLLKWTASNRTLTLFSKARNINWNVQRRRGKVFKKESVGWFPTLLKLHRLFTNVSESSSYLVTKTVRTLCSAPFLWSYTRSFSLSHFLYFFRNL
jgi:hypothetical protein